MQFLCLIALTSWGNKHLLYVYKFFFNIPPGFYNFTNTSKLSTTIDSIFASYSSDGDWR